jgi:multiple sugar transport system permease protein
MIKERFSFSYIVLNGLLIILALIWVFPFFWALSNSFKLEGEIYSAVPTLIPKIITLDNYAAFFYRTNSLIWLKNSIIISIVSIIFICLISCMAGYSLAKIRFPGSNVVFVVMLAAMMVPKYVMIVPLFRLMQSFKWFNTYSGLIIPEIATNLAFGIFLMRQFMPNVPDEIIEAARIDGCNETGIFFKAVLPLLKPVIASLGIICFVHVWNDYLWQLVIASSSKMKTLPIGIAGLNTEQTVFIGTVLAGIVFSSLPLILIYIFLQKYFSRGLTIGAVKG